MLVCYNLSEAENPSNAANLAGRNISGPSISCLLHPAKVVFIQNTSQAHDLQVATQTMGQILFDLLSSRAGCVTIMDL